MIRMKKGYSKERTSVFSLKMSPRTSCGSGWKPRSTLTCASAIVYVVVSILSKSSQGLAFGLDGMKVWRENTNFGNVGNWEGLVNGNCSGNIFSFPGWMDPTVVAFPSSFIGKQIILPVNGHFVFQTGLTTLSDSGTCQHPREVKFRRTKRSDWFDPENWEWKSADSNEIINNPAVPHVERVPCQFDSVQFPSKSTFHLIIPQRVAIRKFFLGDEEKSYTDIAMMMSSELGKLQFQKAPEIDFILTTETCADNDQCICDNYKSDLQSKVCSLSKCSRDVERGECHNTILPHGFCCPICEKCPMLCEIGESWKSRTMIVSGFHIKIKHNGGFKLEPVYQKLKSLASTKSDGINFHVSRHEAKGAHIVIIPFKNSSSRGIQKLHDIVDYLRKDGDVEEVRWKGSWEDIPSDVDKWESEGLSGSAITFILILVLSILIAILVFIFYRKKESYPPFSLSTISNMLPNFTMPNMPNMRNMQMPNINIPLPGRGGGGNTTAGSSTFGFARFTNERISSVNINAGGTLERAEPVDQDCIDSSSGVPLEKVTDASPDFGFANVTYDIIGVTDGSNAETGSTMELISPIESEYSAASISSFHSSTSEKGKNTPPGQPAKPTRLIKKENTFEPIYDQVCEDADDTTAILQSQPDAKGPEE